jgi:hypothetical protein
MHKPRLTILYKNSYTACLYCSYVTLTFSVLQQFLHTISMNLLISQLSKNVILHRIYLFLRINIIKYINFVFLMYFILQFKKFSSSLLFELIFFLDNSIWNAYVVGTASFSENFIPGVFSVAKLSVFVRLRYSLLKNIGTNMFSNSIGAEF